MLKKRTKIFGIFIDDIDINVAISLARASLYGGSSRVFFTPNLEMLEAARGSREIREMLNSSSVSLCDGVGVMLASKLIGAPIKNKVSGIDFGEKLLSLAEKEGARVFLLGGEKGIADEAKRKITKRHPKINICGTHHGYFCHWENERICNLINESRADILVVCRGFPLQEKFVVENKNNLKGVKVFACLGGALDVWSGRTQRAPECVRRINCEWLWRIMNEPRRAKRFLASLPSLFCAMWN